MGMNVAEQELLAQAGWNRVERRSHEIDVVQWPGERVSAALKNVNLDGEAAGNCPARDGMLRKVAQGAPGSKCLRRVKEGAEIHEVANSDSRVKSKSK
jgi:hypothetical protein